MTKTVSVPRFVPTPGLFVRPFGRRAYPACLVMDRPARGHVEFVGGPVAASVPIWIRPRGLTAKQTRLLVNRCTASGHRHVGVARVRRRLTK
jgi:hypothetical protein